MSRAERDGCEALIAGAVFDAEDQAGQSPELPRPAPHRNIRCIIGRPFAPPEVRRGFVAKVAADDQAACTELPRDRRRVGVDIMISEDPVVV